MLGTLAEIDYSKDQIQFARFAIVLAQSTVPQHLKRNIAAIGTYCLDITIRQWEKG